METIAQIFSPPDFNPPAQWEGLSGFSWQTLVTAGINIVLVIATVVFFFMFVMGGIQWITSGGDRGKVEMARKMIVNALIGLLIVFSIFVIIFIINQIFGVNIGGLGSGPQPSPTPPFMPGPPTPTPGLGPGPI